MLERRKVAIFLGATCAYSTGVFGQNSSKNSTKERFLPTPASLQATARLATQKGEPLVILVSLPGCPWCELLRRNYLLPMRGEGVHAFQITVNDGTTVVADFAGNPSSGQHITDLYKAKMNPTLLFFNARGEEIAPRIVGVASTELIGNQIDQSLQTARAVLRKT